MQQNIAQDFYENTVVFITGATGFLGKCLLEKLLWSFPQVSCIFILMREKHGQTVKHRFENFIQHKIFERLRKHFPERFGKVVCLRGNIESDHFGLSLEDRQRLCSEVNIIFHSAATVRFNECLQVAARVNAVGTWHLLELCKQMPKLKSFLYVSTAYCNPGRKYIHEEVYPTLPPVNWKHFIACTTHQNISESYFNSLSNYIKGPHPNTYTFTKSIAEQIVQDYQSILPIVIVRPSIVTAAVQEPYPGWIDNIQGITGIMMEIGKGTISSILGDSHVVCDIIPVDFVVNAMILMSTRATRGNLYISNTTSGVTHPITWHELGRLTLKWTRIYPTKRAMMFPNFKYRKSALMHEIAVFLLHIVPASFMDILSALQPKSKPMLPIVFKFRQACLAGSVFSLNEWFFMNQSYNYFNEISTGQSHANWRLEQLNYDNYIRQFIIGIRKYLHKENFEEDSNKWLMTKIYWTWLFAHIFVVIFFVYLLF